MFGKATRQKTLFLLVSASLIALRIDSWKLCRTIVHAELCSENAVIIHVVLQFSRRLLSTFFHAYRRCSQKPKLHFCVEINKISFKSLLSPTLPSSANILHLAPLVVHSRKIKTHLSPFSHSIQPQVYLSTSPEHFSFSSFSVAFLAAPLYAAPRKLFSDFPPGIFANRTLCFPPPSSLRIPYLLTPLSFSLRTAFRISLLSLL